MDKYTVSKELAERMGKLGWDIKTQYEWFLLDTGELARLIKIDNNMYGLGETNEGECYTTEPIYIDWGNSIAYNKRFFAPIAEEILGELPYFLKDKGIVTNNLTIIKNEKQYMAGYGYYNSEVAEELFYELEISEISLAEALGKFWCLFKEKQLI